MKASHSSCRVEKHDNGHSSYRLPGRKRRGKLWQWTYKIPGLDRLNRLQATNPSLFEIIRDGNISIIKKRAVQTNCEKGLCVFLPTHIKKMYCGRPGSALLNMI